MFLLSVLFIVSTFFSRRSPSATFAWGDEIRVNDIVTHQLQFKNEDGGKWKQGWDIKYDEKQWTNAEPLDVYVVPHSHNDAGW
jgi:hypothetical protein